MHDEHSGSMRSRHGDEYIERLPGGFLLKQSVRHLRIGSDSVLLAEHAPGGRVICDLGCGCGAILLRLAELWPHAELCGLELQPEAARLCRESIELNGISERASVVIGDLRSRAVLGELGAERFDLVVCNPPYNRAGSGRRASTSAAVLEREDGTAPPEAVAAAARFLLKNRGTLVLVLRADRMADYICALRSEHLEPKQITVVRTNGALSRLVLLRAVKGAGAGLVLDETYY